jgi:hypothetical protein
VGIGNCCVVSDRAPDVSACKVHIDMSTASCSLIAHDPTSRLLASYVVYVLYIGITFWGLCGLSSAATTEAVSLRPRSSVTDSL